MPRQAVCLLLPLMLMTPSEVITGEETKLQTLSRILRSQSS